MLWKLPRWKKGDVITAEKLNQMLDAIERATINVGQSAGLNVRQGQGGTSLQVTPLMDKYLGVASSAISARSGATPGTGTVTLQQYEPTDGIVATTTDVDVLNASANTMTSGNGIDSGQYVWVVQDVNGYWWVAPLECS